MIFPKQKEDHYLPFQQLYKMAPPSPGDEAFYPNTEVKMEPGDVIYSSKGWSTFLAGHAGIIGKDLKIYHSHPKGGFADSLPGYLSRHKFGTSLTVLRPKKDGQKAAEWAKNNVGLVERYFFDPRLGGIAINYCTKFIWQAFWHSGSGDITGRGRTIKSLSWIYPIAIKETDFFEEKTTIRLGPKI